ncbi:hypothetical protein [Herpetosiphon gulosus]|uniref:hypothetical protein n=1 Tax=Herpetosiphon gulosus TaxID=1973496 RepID=UPI0031EF447D
MNNNEVKFENTTVGRDVNIKQEYNKSTWITRLINDYLSIGILFWITCAIIGVGIGFYIISPAVDKYIIAYQFHSPGMIRTSMLSSAGILGSIAGFIVTALLLRIIKYYTNYDRSQS